jgi:two-component system chemotaxis sensor kinase CheA
MDSQWTKYLALPSEITPFEQHFLARLNKVGLVFFCLHIPVLMAVAWAAGTGPLRALALTLLVVSGPAIAFRTLHNPRRLSVVYGITAMLMGGLLVHFGQGPVQIEMHFYFFALLAMLCIFANPMVNLAAAATVVLHHVLGWWLLPSSVFNYDAQWWVLVVHAAFVLLETVAACYISRQFFDNVIGLEKIVEARTATIRENQREMDLILSNVEEGLVTIDLNGQMSSETSRAAAAWFGQPLPGEAFASWTGRKDAGFADWFALALESVREEILPVDVAVSQLPARLKEGARTYSVRYQLIDNASSGNRHAGAEVALEKRLLAIITDVTVALTKDAREREQADLLQLFQHMLRDKAGFLEFLTEADEIMSLLKHGRVDDLDHLKRLVHTLKGNSAIFGLRRVSETCHAVENEIAEQSEAAAGLEMDALKHAWEQIRTEIEKLIGNAPSNGIEIETADHEAILKALRGGVDSAILARMIESWRLEPAGKRLVRIERQIQRIAERMGKGKVLVSLEPNGLRFHSERFAPFWSAFVHVLTNSVDHGVEDRDERLRRGKPEESQIRVATEIEGSRFVVSVEDDGPGVDWERLRMRAIQLGAAGNAVEEPEKLICLPGLSSKEKVTELSGRGMGMGAVAKACEALGGTIKVKSRLGFGTRIEFSFPKDDSVYEGNAAILLAAQVAAAA